MPAIKAVIFDWAGTMVDFGSRAPVMAMMSVFEARNAPIGEALVRQFMGSAKRDHVKLILSTPQGEAAWRKASDRPWTEEDVDGIMEALEPAMAEAARTCSALIPDALDTVRWLRARGIRIGSTTGYTRPMMQGILPSAAEQGYEPDVTVCAGETRLGRPAPEMIWRVLSALQAWPVAHCVKVDDAPVGIAAGRNAGLWTVGVAASGNGTGLSLAKYEGLSPDARRKAAEGAIAELTAAGADFVIASVADLPQVIERIEISLREGKLPGGAPAAVSL